MASRCFSSPFPHDVSKDQGAAGLSGCPSFCQHCGWPVSYGTKLEGKCECLYSMALLLFSLSIQVRNREKKQKCSQEETCEIQELAGFSWLPFLFLPGVLPHYRSCRPESSGPRLPARGSLTPASPAANSSTR